MYSNIKQHLESEIKEIKDQGLFKEEPKFGLPTKELFAKTLFSSIISPSFNIEISVFLFLILFSKNDTNSIAVLNSSIEYADVPMFLVSKLLTFEISLSLSIIGSYSLVLSIDYFQIVLCRIKKIFACSY